jgi:hypothetical protein
MKHLNLCLLVVLLVAGCTSTSKYESKAAAGPAKAADYPIYVYTENATVPRPYEVIGTMHVGDTPFTVMGGSLESVMNKLMQNARQKGADALQLLSVKSPDFTTAHYRADANFIRFTNVWESISAPEEELQDYFRTNAPKLDPIEGIWRASDRLQSRVAVLKNNSKAGRDFIAIILNTKNLSWQKGDKKADIRRGERPGVYRGSYYRDDYEEIKVAITMRLPATNRFTVIIDESDPVVFLRE